MRAVIHSLLYYAPLPVLGKDKIVMIQLITILQDIVINLGSNAAVINERLRVNSERLGEFLYFRRSFA